MRAHLDEREKTYFFPVLITLADVDAANVIFYPRLFFIIQEAMEHFINEHWADNGKSGMAGLVQKTGQAPLVVHCQSTYRKPIVLSEKLYVCMVTKAIGSKSFTMAFKLKDLKKENVYAEAEVTHVAVSIKTRLSENLSNGWRDLIHSLYIGER